MLSDATLGHVFGCSPRISAPEEPPLAVARKVVARGCGSITEALAAVRWAALRQR